MVRVQDQLVRAGPNRAAAAGGRAAARILGDSRKEVLSPMRGDTTQLALDAIYDLFRGVGGMHPSVGDLQHEFNRQGNSSLDAVQVVRHIPPTLLKPLPIAAGYPAPAERLILTVEGIERCAGSGQDIENFVIAIKWLARQAD